MLDESETELDRRKVDLSEIIVETLRTHPYLSYFQGFHDIVQVFLLVLGKDPAIPAVARLSLLRIRDFMLPSISPAFVHLELLPAILYTADEKLYHHLSGTRPFFALPATLTLYAHEIQEYSDIARLFDFLLAQEAAVAVYFFANIVLSRKTELLEIPIDDPDMLHFTLSKLPKPMDLDGLITGTMQLFSQHPPPSLPFRIWRTISPYSVLKTTRRPESTAPYMNPIESMSQGKAFFDRQAAQLRWIERRDRTRAVIWRYRWSAGGLGIAIVVGGLSIWLQRQHESGLSGFLAGLWIRIHRSRGSH